MAGFFGKISAEGLKKAAKAGAVVAGGWLAKKFGDKVADEAYEKGKKTAGAKGENRKQLALAQDLARANGWRYTERTVVDHQHRYVVWNQERKPMAAFPKVEGAETPEALAQRFEFAEFIPTDDELIEPPPV